jgi:hypothetical protein
MFYTRDLVGESCLENQRIHDYVLQEGLNVIKTSQNVEVTPPETP